MTGSIAMTRRFANAIPDRRYFIGGSDARIIMGEDEAALIRLWPPGSAWRRDRTSEPALVRRHEYAVPSSSLLPWRLSKAHAVLVEELNARGLQSGPERRFVCGSHRNFTLDSFHPANRGYAHFRCLGQIESAPPE
jgi:hypothetical protein